MKKFLNIMTYRIIFFYSTVAETGFHRNGKVSFMSIIVPFAAIAGARFTSKTILLHILSLLNHFEQNRKSLRLLSRNIFNNFCESRLLFKSHQGSDNFLLHLEKQIFWKVLWQVFMG